MVSSVCDATVAILSDLLLYSMVFSLQARAKVTGRVVPRALLEKALDQVPKSIEVLAPLVDYYAEINNPPDAEDVELIKPSGSTWEHFGRQWVQYVKVLNIWYGLAMALSPTFTHHESLFIVTVVRREVAYSDDRKKVIGKAINSKYRLDKCKSSLESTISTKKGKPI